MSVKRLTAPSTQTVRGMRRGCSMVRCASGRRRRNQRMLPPRRSARGHAPRHACYVGCADLPGRDAMRWPFSLSPLEHGAFVFVGLLIYVMVTRIGQQHRHPSAAIAWVMAIVLLPYLGVPLFLLFGTRKLSKARHPAAAGPSKAVRADGPPWALELLAALNVPAPVRNEAIHFHADGDAALRALIGLIDGARGRIDLSAFVLIDDRVGAAVA